MVYRCRLLLCLLITADCMYVSMYVYMYAICYVYRCLTLQGHTMDVLDLSWSPPEMHLLVSCSIDNKLLLWDLNSCYVWIHTYIHTYISNMRITNISSFTTTSNVSPTTGEGSRLCCPPLQPPKKVNSNLQCMYVCMYVCSHIFSSTYFLCYLQCYKVILLS